MGLLEVNAPRILIEADLWPVQGERFQPTGFPDLGPAAYRLPDGTEKLLVESPQSMANRLEAVCWDEARNDLVGDLQGLPYVRIDLGRFGITSSILEFHRLNSPYIWELDGDERRQQFHKSVSEALGVEGQRRRGRQTGKATKERAEVPGVVDIRKLAALCLRYDPNSIVHGVFLEKVAGRFRLPRALSSFIEATRVTPAESGGAKLDRVFPAADQNRGIRSEEGFTNVTFPRTEFTAERITAYFNFDAALVASYGLPPEGERLIRTLALWKVRRFLDGGLRLRSACDLDCKEVRVIRPDGEALPNTAELGAAVKEAIKACRKAGLFVEPPVTEIATVVPDRAAKRERDEDVEESS